jgi:integrase
MSRRTFGTIRQRASGRFQARYWLDGEQVSIPGTFESRKAASAALARRQTELERGVRVNPRSAKERFDSYASRVIDQRVLAPRTAELYRSLLERHLQPTFGAVPIGSIAPSSVRTWHTGLAKDHPTTAAKAYRLLNLVMRIALDDDVIGRNPCRIEGGGVEHAPERPTATLAEVEKMIEVMPEHLRALISLALWCQLRRGELLALRRRDLDLVHARVTIARAAQRLTGEQVSYKEPKSRASRRRVAIPPHILDDLGEHLARFVGSEHESPLFTSSTGGPISAEQLNRHWNRARLAAGRPDLHLHDLRHTGATLAAATGASTKDLMARLGHSSPRAALIYQHASEDRDRVVADALAQWREPAKVVPIRPTTRPPVGP